MEDSKVSSLSSKIRQKLFRGQILLPLPQTLLLIILKKKLKKVNFFNVLFALNSWTEKQNIAEWWFFILQSPNLSCQVKRSIFLFIDARAILGQYYLLKAHLWIKKEMCRGTGLKPSSIFLFFSSKEAVSSCIPTFVSSFFVVARRVE